MDDTYDTYGTLNELTLLTNAIESDYCWITPSQDKIDILVIRVVMKKLLKAYFQETKWYHGKIVPKMEQYVKNGALSSTYHLLATTFLLGMGDVATKDAFDWIATEPPILVASGIIARLLNDLVSHEIEQERGDAASGIECYMNEYGVTKEKARMEIRKLIANYWKDLNEDYLKHIIVISRVLLMVMLNLTRTAEFVYKDEDAYSFSNNNLKDVISMLLIHPIIT
ncbi:hypothetical protein KY290_011024 [Solanum tuberosum]|uniref:Terpene synthase metal-binding domain-containing protein n=1 Tax=Solanum tuberosum TaxID=4113 RepID=A0ABQ7VZE4_SOLTU|nr:hypothetical protein KY290_011024 [Solanum tuberosum]